VIVWRIAAETRAYSADDLSGTGAAKGPGRWNDAGEQVVYCAPTIAMAVLETAAHVEASGFPLNRYLVRIDLPDGEWRTRERVDAAALPAGWDAVPAGRASMRFGSAWIASRRSLVLELPSVIVPEEPILLINPRHPTAASVVATPVRRFEYQRLFRKVRF
jgi:RES domain-containing protein